MSYLLELWLTSLGVTELPVIFPGVPGIPDSWSRVAGLPIRYGQPSLPPNPRRLLPLPNPLREGPS